MMGPLPLWAEVAFAAVEDGTDGTIVVDGVMLGIGLPGQVERADHLDGRERARRVKIEGGDEARRLREVIDGVENATVIGEFAFGVSEVAPFGTPSEKGRVGTVHFALGDNHNAYPGGQNVLRAAPRRRRPGRVDADRRRRTLDPARRRVGAVSGRGPIAGARARGRRSGLALGRAVELDSPIAGSWSRMVLNASLGQHGSLGYSVFTPGSVTAMVSTRPRRSPTSLSGSGELRLDDGPVPVRRGQGCSSRAGVWHAVANTGEQDVVMVFGFPHPDYPPDRAEGGVTLEAREPAPAAGGARPAGGRGGRVGSRILALHGYEDLTLGHVSARGADGRTIYIKRKGVALERGRPRRTWSPSTSTRDNDNLGEGMHLETVLHTEVYKRRPDVRSVVHGHPPYATAFGATDADVRLPDPRQRAVPDGISTYDGVPDLIMDARQGALVAEALGEGTAVLLRNHGVLVAERDLAWAVLAERAARARGAAAGDRRFARPAAPDPARPARRDPFGQVPAGLRGGVLGCVAARAAAHGPRLRDARDHKREGRMSETIDVELTRQRALGPREHRARQELLLDFVRERLALTGAKRSCDVQVCGTCTVLVDGGPVSACTYLAVEADGRDVLTIEGFAQTRRIRGVRAGVRAPRRVAMRLLHARAAADTQEPARCGRARAPSRICSTASTATCAAAPGYRSILDAAREIAGIRHDGCGADPDERGRRLASAQGRGREAARQRPVRRATWRWPACFTARSCAARSRTR